MKPQIISIAGKSNAGKTTLMEKLIAELTRRGYEIGSVKHAHDGFEIDKEGKDSWRHKNAGASAALIVTGTKAALVKDDRRPALEKLEAYLGDMDIILVEGLKQEHLPKIEIFRKGGDYDRPLFLDSPDLIAFVTDSDFSPDVPLFGLDQIDAIASFIEKLHLSHAHRETI
ncbi:molybdopterin-guanine dinucleotide biosynthesis protein B [Desulfospira joergensenii]|uniref:molybdopterin-guanine dinucleotide biosynthesis protein B n=1 Tax=Desulfospira joergensenii TaxID=53329 RepID=UPI000484C3EB|nr:molybdopterin-guanine dinucleotide biosynthesis protein B [Desulfospira joergensenii]